MTAISGDAQRTLDFYAGVLGLRFVKRTVNFDDPGSYHFYFGDAVGTPGSILTFFPWGDAPRGRPGAGQAVAVALAVPPGAIAGWVDRLVGHGIPFEGPRPHEGDGLPSLRLTDPDGLALALVGDPDVEALPGWHDPARSGAVRAADAVRGVYSVAVAVRDAAPTAAVLALLGCRPAGTWTAPNGAAVTRYAPAAGVGPDAGDPPIGRYVDLHAVGAAEAAGRGAVGSVHHIAFRVGDDAGELAARAAVMRAGLSATPQVDREYFRSVYFREPGGVLFEFATDAPGFAVDETPDALGAALKLPPQYEAARAEIERRLPPLRVPGGVARTAAP